MDKQNPVCAVKAEDLHLEAVLDSGFWGDYSFSEEFHAHTYYELVLALEGSVCLEPSRETPVCLQPGQACLLTPGTYHRTRAVTAQACKLAIRFHCSREGHGHLYESFCQALENSRGLLLLGDRPQLHYALRQLQQELLENAVGQELFLRSLLVQVFLLLLRDLSNGAPLPPPEVQTTDNARRWQLEEFLSSKFQEPVTEEDLSEYLHLSQRQVSRILGKIYGKSFRQLLMETRLQYASQLLAETNLPVEQIAEKAGYTSLSGFYEAFQKIYGMTPGQHRKHSAKQP